MQQKSVKADLFEDAKYDFDKITPQRKESVLRQIGKTVEALADRYQMSCNVTGPEQLLEFLLANSTQVLRYISFNLIYFQDIAKQSRATRDSITSLCDKLQIRG